MSFQDQIIRKDVLINMLNNMHLSKKELFNIIMSENNKKPNDSRAGYLFETLCEILIFSKCINGINYTQYLNDDDFRQITNIKDVLNGNIHRGNSPTDINLKNENTVTSFSIKYRNEFKPKDSDVTLIDNILRKKHDNYKVGLIVKNKKLVLEHRYIIQTNDERENLIKSTHDKVIQNKLLFDTIDIKIGLETFCNRFRDMDYNNFINLINEKYLLSPRQQLILKLHQKMTLDRFINNLLYNKHLISHKPRSGKSITILIMCKHLFKNNYNKILIMTSVPATIDSFKKDLDTYIDFSDIEYKDQDDFNNIDTNYNGIVFCSTQYLKTNNDRKKEYLKNINFDVIIADESHQGSSTNNTQNNILNVEDINDFTKKNTRLFIFASGTADKTEEYYKIKNNCIYEWNLEDESYMKTIIKDDNEDIKQIMRNRHGEIFMECLYDDTLNKDYSNAPIQVLIKHSISDKLINTIIDYNSKNKTEYGYSSKSLFALCFNNNTQQYENRFELEKTQDGKNILKWFLETIISNDKMNKETIIQHIERLQFSRISRQSSIESPLLHIIYLPTHTGNNTIALLQETLKKFLEDNNLWTEYQIEYSNSIDDTGNCLNETYNEYIISIMERTKANHKKGCILLLGDKGSVGITYHDCDVTISLDDGHNLDLQKQRYSRALTEAKNKTIGINVDMNIQRTYEYLNNIISKFKTIVEKNNSNSNNNGINGLTLKYLYENNIFLFDPHQFENKPISPISYYNIVGKNIIDNIMNRINGLENSIQISNEDIEDNFKNIDYENTNNATKEIDHTLDGEQQYCPKGETSKQIIVSLNDQQENEIDSDIELQVQTVIEDVNNEVNKNEENKKKLRNMCGKLLFPLLGLLSRTYTISDLKDLFKNNDNYDNVKNIIKSFLIEKKIILNENNTLESKTIVNIMNKNDEIVQNIREIYRSSPPELVQELIAKHFIPSSEEKKNNAEIPTPLQLVDEMLSKIPIDFWSLVHTVLEPCCGKGNFVMRIFNKFFDGLVILYPNVIERCKVIINECIYYTDLTSINVFITTEILKCHIKLKTGLEIIDEEEFKFNKTFGDTLKMNIEEVFNVNKFDAVIGNPPYNDDSGNKGKGHMLWDKFIMIAFNKFLEENGYLVYVHPSVWRQIEHPLLNVLKDKQLIYLEIHNVNDGQKIFKCATRYDWYVLQNKKCETTTTIKGEDRKMNVIDLREWKFIPNMMFDEIKYLISNDNKLDINYYRSNYGADKKWVRKIKNEEYKYPVVYSINKENVLSLCYSNTNKNGHFKKSKFIFSNGAGFYCDYNGNYGLTQWAYCIYDTIENLPLIEKTFRNSKFNKIIDAIQLDSSSYNIKVMKLFGKDFYYDFIDSEKLLETIHPIQSISLDDDKYKILFERLEKYYEKIINKFKI